MKGGEKMIDIGKIVADIVDVATKPAPIAVIRIINRHGEEEKDEGD